MENVYSKYEYIRQLIIENITKYCSRILGCIQKGCTESKGYVNVLRTLMLPINRINKFGNVEIRAKMGIDIDLTKSTEYKRFKLYGHVRRMSIVTRWSRKIMVWSHPYRRKQVDREAYGWKKECERRQLDEGGKAATTLKQTTL